MPITTIRRLALAALLVSTAVAATSASAQTDPAQDVAGHPRVNEVNQRVDNQQNRIDNGVANGSMTANQAARDEKHDTNIAQRTSADEARHNGHLTKTEQNNLNRAANRNSQRIARQKH